MIEGRDLENIVNSVIRFKKWEWGVRLITSGVTILALLVFLKYLSDVRW